MVAVFASSSMLTMQLSILLALTLQYKAEPTLSTIHYCWQGLRLKINSIESRLMVIRAQLPGISFKLDGQVIQVWFSHLYLGA